MKNKQTQEPYKVTNFVYTDKFGKTDNYQRFDYEDFRVDQGLMDHLEFLKVFENNNNLYEHPVLMTLDQAQLDWEMHKQVCRDSNLMVLWKLSQLIERFEPEWKYKNAFINWARLNVILFLESPYWRSRLGHLLWWAVNYANPDSYYILKWEYLYDPRAWYKPGEPRRSQDSPPDEKGGESPATC